MINEVEILKELDERIELQGIIVEHSYTGNRSGNAAYEQGRFDEIKALRDFIKTKSAHGAATPMSMDINSLTQETLQEIITQSHNSPIKSLNRLINTTQNVKISITDSATQAIANEAIQKDTGARSLYNTIYTLLIPYIYRVPSQNIDELQIDTDESSTLYVKEVRQQGGRCLLCGVDIADITVTEPYIDYK